MPVSCTSHADAQSTLATLIAALAAADAGGPGGTARAQAVCHLDDWLARGGGAALSAADEANLIAAGRWLLDDRPDHPVVPLWAARSSQVLRMADEPQAAVLAAFSFEHAIRVGDFVGATRLDAEMRARTALRDSARLAWLPLTALCRWLCGYPGDALVELETALQDPALTPGLRYALLEQGAAAALAAGDPSRGLAFVERGLQWQAKTPQSRAQLWFLQAGAFAALDDDAAARAAMARCERCAQPADSRYVTAWWRLGDAVARLQCGEARSAERDMTGLLGDVSLMRARFLEWSVRLERAAARRALGHGSAAEDDLRAALRVAAGNGYVSCAPWGISGRVRSLLAFALDRGIEPATVSSLLVRRRLVSVAA